MPGSPGTTWSLLALEAGIAISALWPWRAFAQGLHHGLLLMFCLTTYAFAPVAGFGWLLLIMGLAQCEERQRMLRRTYVAAFLLMLFYAEVPWAGLLLDWLRSS
jgi:hypothetical protein